MVAGSHQIEVKADKHIDELLNLDGYAAVVIPGGMPGAANLRDDPRVVKIVNDMNAAGKISGRDLCRAHRARQSWDHRR